MTPDVTSFTTAFYGIRTQLWIIWPGLIKIFTQTTHCDWTQTTGKDWNPIGTQEIKRSEAKIKARFNWTNLAVSREDRRPKPAIA